MSALGVGIIGSGPVTQAIHLPTLARLIDLFRVVRVTDVNPQVAESVAQRVGAAWSTDLEPLLDDPEVEVVAVCSPHQFHAEQVIAACRAGKRAVLCEKPFAMTADEATRVAEVADETRVPILVGAMHAYDPGWLAAADERSTIARTADWVRLSIALPPNPRFEDFATEVVARPAPAPSVPPTVEELALLVRGGVMGLAIHDLPLVRSLIGEWRDLEVLSARFETPFGYVIALRSGNRIIELHAAMTENWEPDWVLEVSSPERVLRTSFSPSYVHGGSAETRVDGLRNSTVHGPFPANGYENEWQELHVAAHGGRVRYSTAELIEDLRFALTIADGAHDRVLLDGAGGAR